MRHHHSAGRTQRRYKERVNADANKVLAKLIVDFLKVIQAQNSTEDEVVLNAFEENEKKWKDYCFLKRLNPVAKNYFATNARKNIAMIEEAVKSKIPMADEN